MRTKQETVTITPQRTSGVAGMSGVGGMVHELIAENGLGAGDRLPPIRELAERFGVKAGTVRDALLDAQGKGYVKVLPRVGAIVQSPVETRRPQRSDSNVASGLRHVMAEQEHNLFHVLDAREVIELNAVAQASKRCELPDLFKLRQILDDMAAMPVTVEEPAYVDLDVQFHLEICRLSRNAVMTSMLEVLMQELRPQLIKIRWSNQRRGDTDASHARIYSAIVARDVEAGQAEMRAHLRTAYNSLLDEIRKPPAPEPSE
jgi:GntR family transcriptional repressor for pyruvate dehydrogenase complex